MGKRRIQNDDDDTFLYSLAYNSIDNSRTSCQQQQQQQQQQRKTLTEYSKRALTQLGFVVKNPK